MTDQPAVATGFVAPMTIPPALLMWAGIYSVMFYVCGGMIAAMYDPS